MNKLIASLADQAKESVPCGILAPDLWIQEYNRIFAELIIRECALYMYTNYPASRYQVNYMRKHMGDPDWNKLIEVQE
jgi:hypothetical protein